MTWGLLDLASPLLSWMDGALAAVLPTAGRLVLWGLVAAAFSMALYAVVSPQQRLRRVRKRAVDARRALDSFDGSFAEARPLIAAMLTSSMRQLGLVLAPALLASLPLLFLLAWLHGSFAYVLPEPSAAVSLRTEPQGYQASLQPTEERVGEVPVPSLVVRDGTGRVVEARALNAPVTVLHKAQWWNSLIANPLGYLADDSPLERVEIDLPRLEVISFGPAWLRTWEAVFFTALVAASLAIKLAFRLV